MTTTEPEPAFLEEGATMLQVYLGINPLENARSAAEGVWYWLCNDVLPQPPRQWREALAWMEHPQMQANLAYWKAMGPWLMKQGQHPVPVEDWEEAKAPVAAVEVMPPLEQITVPKPLPELIFLPEESFEKLPRFRLTEDLNTEVVKAAEACACGWTKERDSRLAEKLEAVASAVKKKGLKKVDIAVAGLKDFSAPAKQIVDLWMKVTKFSEPGTGLVIFFKFEKA